MVSVVGVGQVVYTGYYLQEESKPPWLKILEMREIKKGGGGEIPHFHHCIEMREWENKCDQRMFSHFKHGCYYPLFRWMLTHLATAVTPKNSHAQLDCNFTFAAWHTHKLEIRYTDNYKKKEGTRKDRPTASTLASDLIFYHGIQQIALGKAPHWRGSCCSWILDCMRTDGQTGSSRKKLLSGQTDKAAHILLARTGEEGWISLCPSPFQLLLYRSI